MLVAGDSYISTSTVVYSLYASPNTATAAVKPVLRYLRLDLCFSLRAFTSLEACPVHGEALLFRECRLASSAVSLFILLLIIFPTAEEHFEGYAVTTLEPFL